MAIVINPDGTVSAVDVYYNRDGSIKGIKGQFSSDKGYTKSISNTNPRKKKKNNKNTYLSTPTINPKKETKKGTYLNIPADTPKKENSSNVIAVSTPTTKQSTPITPIKKVKRVVKPSKPITERPAEDSSLEPYFTSVVEIDQYIADKKNKEQTIDLSEYQNIRRSLPGTLCSYFTSKCKAYFTYCKEKAQMMLGTTTITKKKKNKKKVSNDVTFSSRRIQVTKNDIDNRSSSGGFSRKPQYGYARDRYGRVQDRDRFNEEKRNEFYTAQNRQKNYDYSSYDANDDHDGAYSDWE